METKFKVGEVVKLKSGAAAMTVESYYDLNEKIVSCVWHEKNKHYRENYLEDTLQKQSQ